MGRKSVHVTYRKDDSMWHVNDGKNGQEQGSYKTQQEAMKKGRKMAMETSCEFVVHGRDGKIRLSQSYGNDPRNSESKSKRQSKTQSKSNKNSK